MTTEPSPPITEDDDALLDTLTDAIALIVALDAPELSDAEREVLVGHLTGAVYVTVRNAR